MSSALRNRIRRLEVCARPQRLLVRILSITAPAETATEFEARARRIFDASTEPVVVVSQLDNLAPWSKTV